MANWKLYLDGDETMSLVRRLVYEGSVGDSVQVVLFPTLLTLSEVVKQTTDTSYLVGTQNIAWVPKGAYTGAVSADLCKQAGAEFALVGHSERRYMFGETDEDVRKKIEACFDAGLTPVVCIGETADDVEAGKRQYRLKKQIMHIFTGLEITKDQQLFLAYEPVWAISHGKQGEACTPVDVADVSGWLQKEVETYTSYRVPVLYGGSVDSENVLSYTSLPFVDGVLVGGAATHYESLMEIIQKMADESRA